jgi:beta-galactosidase
MDIYKKRAIFLLIKRKGVLLISLFLIGANATFAMPIDTPRQHILMDFDWRFAFGHPFDTKKDFDNGTGYFSYFAKAGYGDGAASPSFDDRAWRKINLPHDWAVEQPFDAKASFSHGFKAIGRNYPDASVGWYRKSFHMAKGELGKHISIAFDGIFRNSIVWVNGHYLGTELSGYNAFEYNISEYLNYGGENVIAVRVDATMEEGWFYEGAGIYRHVWLNETDPLHVATNGTYVSSKVNGSNANESVAVAVINEDKQTKNFTIKNTIVDADGKVVARDKSINLSLKPFTTQDYNSNIEISNPRLWSIEKPNLYKMMTEIVADGKIIDQYQTTFGVRTIRFDANEGFFLNGKPVKIKGTDNHQDHAGVGSAIPDDLQDFRIATLKSLGSNAYRCSHNPPTPELLDACDRYGMLVIDENRLMGVSSYHFDNIKKLITRDRNHPSVISWSVGNEEWNIENNITGIRIASTLQAYAKTLDSTRFITAAFSGDWHTGISSIIDVVGYNYIGQENTDGHHEQYPNQPSWGTEEGSTHATRGVYFDNDSLHLIAAYDKKPNPRFFSIEEGWNHYIKRPYLGGMFIWTGFDYRGEPSPYGWPSIGSYFGMLDQCGFLKDDAWYLRAWWTDETVLHLLPHWNWTGKEGQDIDVWAYSNCDEVELLLNKKRLGKKTVPQYGHLEWKVKYQPGSLEAIGYKKGKKIATDVVKTTAAAENIALYANKTTIKPDKQSLSIITVKVNDVNGLAVPTANNLVNFTISGPGKIIGVGNGDPTSLEADQYLEKVVTQPIENLKEKYLNDPNTEEVKAVYDDSKWQKAFKENRDSAFGDKVKKLVYRGLFNLPANSDKATVTLLYSSIGKQQSIYVNGTQIVNNIPLAKKGNAFIIDKSFLKIGANNITIVASPLLKEHDWDNINMNPGLVQLVYPAETWKRKLFNGLAQVIVQSTGEPGQIVLTATAPGLKRAVINVAASN